MTVNPLQALLLSSENAFIFEDDQKCQTLAWVQRIDRAAEESLKNLLSLKDYIPSLLSAAAIKHLSDKEIFSLKTLALGLSFSILKRAGSIFLDTFYHPIHSQISIIFSQKNYHKETEKYVEEVFLKIQKNYPRLIEHWLQLKSFQNKEQGISWLIKRLHLDSSFGFSMAALKSLQEEFHDHGKDLIENTYFKEVVLRQLLHLIHHNFQCSLSRQCKEPSINSDHLKQFSKASLGLSLLLPNSMSANYLGPFVEGGVKELKEAFFNEIQKINSKFKETDHVTVVAGIIHLQNKKEGASPSFFFRVSQGKYHLFDPSTGFFELKTFTSFFVILNRLCRSYDKEAKASFSVYAF